MTLTTMIVVSAFIGVATLVLGIAALLRGKTDTVVENRLATLTATGLPRSKEVQANLLLSPLEGTKGFAETVLSNVGSLRLIFDQADLPLTPGRFLAVSGALGGFAALLCAVGKVPFFLIPIFVLTATCLPFVWLVLRRRKRLRNFGKQLPEALELISRALRAGHSLAAGFNLVASEMGGPIAKEFGRCYEEQNFGIPLEDALDEMTERVPNLDLRFFATAVILQRQTGGDLAEILDKIGRLIRERFKIWGQIQALTGEGRLSGIVLLALPPLLFMAMYRINPEYCMPLFTDPLGHKMLAGAVIMQVLGAIVIKKIININV